jgi:hypothetical protein
MRGVPLLGDPVARVLTCLKFMDHAAFRGLIRSTALARTSGLLLSDFDPFDSYGTEMRFLMELALLGEFRFVPGPVYYKRLHGANLYLKREKWPEHKKLRAWACLSAWAVEVIAPAGQSKVERRRMFDMVLDRFLVPRDPWKRLKDPVRRLAHSRSAALHPIRVVVDWLKRNDPLIRSVSGRWMLYETTDPKQRAAFLRIVFDRLKSAGRFDPATSLDSSWQTLEEEAHKRFVGA